MMTTFTDEDIAEALLFRAYFPKGVSQEDAQNKFDELEQQNEAYLSKHYHDLRQERREGVFQNLLEAAGGDAEKVARMLFSMIGDGDSVDITKRDPQTPTSKPSGRPASKWGNGSFGKLLLYIEIEDIRKTMQLNEGVKNPKINEAVARFLNVPELYRTRRSIVAKIRDYAARYSEAKKILKSTGKLDAFK